LTTAHIFQMGWFNHQLEMVMILQDAWHLMTGF